MKVSYQQILDIANELKTYSESMNELLTNIKGDFNKIGTDGVWSGEAAEAVKAEFEKLSAKFPEFYETIVNCYTHLNTVVQNYQSVDNSINGQA